MVHLRFSTWRSLRAQAATLAFLMLVGAGFGATATLYPIDDAFVRGGSYGGDSYGALPNDSGFLVVKYDANVDFTRETYLKFDLTSISGTVQTATLHLAVRQQDTNGVGHHYLREVEDDAWAEASVTYATRPTAWSALVLDDWIAPAVGSSVSIDLTDAVNNRTDDHLSLVIYSDDNRYAAYYSKDGNPVDVRPRLVLIGDGVEAPGPVGRVRMEYWEGLAAPTLSGLAAAPGFPDRPTGRDYPPSLETERGFRDSYGVLLRGYFHAPATGDYMFYISAADAAGLWLSVDHTVAGLRPSPVAEVTAATNWRQWDAQPSQQSSPISLVRGEKYYFEARMAAGTGDDHLSIGWRLPDGTLERPVPGDRVSPYLANEFVPPGGSVLDQLATGHPRLMASEHTFARLRRMIVEDPDMTSRWEDLKRDADGLLSVTPSTYDIVGGRLLSVSRRVLDRVETLAMAYNLSYDAAYLQRALDEMTAAANFPDWHPVHFLDTAELTAALAIGYDWLHSDLSAGDRLALRNAIVNLGLNEGIADYDGDSGGFWTTGDNNWNQVCNGGMGLGALAIADVDPTKATEVIDKALQSYNLIYLVPDGGWIEGPGYWGYATRYITYLFAGAETAVGHTYGLAERLGASQTGFFPIYMNRPSHTSFNFSDSGDGEVTNSPQHYWLGWRYGYPGFGRYQREYDRSDARELLWFDRRGRLPGETPLALDHIFESCGVSTMRSSWDWGYPTFAGLKAGINNGGHWHLDLGSFVFDALGQDFAIELGGNSYGTAGVSDYFSNSQRWKYYKVRAEGHNTLMLNPDDQADQAFGHAPFTEFWSDAEGAYTIVDLSEPYRNDATRVQRGVMMRNYRREAIVHDEIEGLSGARELYWFLHTRADIQILDGGLSAMLTQGGQRLWAHILDAPAGAVFGVMDAVPLPTSPVPTNGQDATDGIRKLYIHHIGAANPRLAVWLVPLETGDLPPTASPSVVALDNWDTVAFNDPGTGFGAAPRPESMTLLPPTGWNPDEGMVSFRAYSGNANGQIVPIVVLADNSVTPELDYYYTELTAGWVGWKQCNVPIADFVPVNSPSGWQSVTQVQFHSDGHGAMRLGDSVLNVDGLDTRPLGDLFGDLPAPQKNLAFKPPSDWNAALQHVAFDLFSYAATGQEMLLLCMSEDDSADGPDYYRYSITVDWTGWKRFVVPFDQFSTVRQPLGWDRLNEIRFYTDGWSMTLTPGTVMSLYDFGTNLPGHVFGNIPAPGPNVNFERRVDWPVRYGYIIFDLFSMTANGQRVDAVFHADNPATPAPDYYWFTTYADWSGWKTFAIPMSEFASIGSPLAWDAVTEISFNTTGYGGTLKPDSLLTLFDAGPGLPGVKFGDAPAPSGTGQVPIPADWNAADGLVEFDIYSEVANNQPIQVIFASENPNGVPDGSDYYRIEIIVDWTGWRHFSIPFSQFGTARQPLGWDQLTGIRFYTSGWGTTLFPDTYLSVYNLHSGLSPVQSAAGAWKQYR